LGRGRQVVRPAAGAAGQVPALEAAGVDEAAAVPVVAGRVLLDRDLDLGESGRRAGRARLDRIAGGAADVGRRRRAAGRVARGVVVGVVGREADLRDGLLAVEQGRVVGDALRLGVAGLVGGDGVEGVVAVALGGRVAEAVVDPGARVGVDLVEARVGRALGVEVDGGQPGGGAVLERVAGGVGDVKAGARLVVGHRGGRDRIVGVVLEAVGRAAAGVVGPVGRRGRDR